MPLSVTDNKFLCELMFNNIMFKSHIGEVSLRYIILRGLPVYSETNREHWEKVLNKGVSPLQRRSVLIPDANVPHSPARCGQLREHVSTMSPSQETVTVGLEDAPFIFCPFMTDSKSCVEDLIQILHKYALDKYQKHSYRKY